MDDVEKLLDALRDVEFDGGEDLDEMSQPEVREELLEECRELEESGTVREHEFTLPEHWGRRLFVALCRRYELEPYRYSDQPRMTVMVEGPEEFVEERLWPRFVEYTEMLEEHIEHVTTMVIEELLDGDPELANIVHERPEERERDSAAQ